MLNHPYRPPNAPVQPRDFQSLHHGAVWLRPWNAGRGTRPCSRSNTRYCHAGRRWHLVAGSWVRPVAMADADNDNRRAQPGRKGVRVRRTDPAPHGGGLFGNRQPHAARDAVRAAQAPPASAAVVWKLHDFVVLEELYRATTGFVHHVRHRSDGREYVLKARTDAELGRHKDIMHEVKLLTRLRHPHIIRCYGHFWNESRSTLFVPCLWLTAIRAAFVTHMCTTRTGT